MSNSISQHNDLALKRLAREESFFIPTWLITENTNYFDVLLQIGYVILRKELTPQKPVKWLVKSRTGFERQTHGSHTISSTFLAIAKLCRCSGQIATSHCWVHHDAVNVSPFTKRCVHSKLISFMPDKHQQKTLKTVRKKKQCYDSLIELHKNDHVPYGKWTLVCCLRHTNRNLRQHFCASFHNNHQAWTYNRTWDGTDYPIGPAHKD